MPVPQQLRIIVVEDSRDLLDGWIEIFSMDGHEVRGYGYAGALLADEASLRDAHIVISDYYLPDINGLELIVRLRGIRSDLPVILLTGARDPSIREQMAQIPAAKLLKKPLNIEDMENAIQGLLVDYPQSA